jgi:uncharacterized membrane protein YvbJ
MALRTCNECGKEYYDMADKCPNCSAPNSNPTYRGWKMLRDDAEKRDERKKNSIWNRIGFFINLD